MEKVVFGNTPVELTVFNREDFFKLGRVHISACFSLPIKADSLLLTKNPRGWDFLGGHTEEGETPFETMKRESLEEAGIKINQAELLAAVKVFNPDWKEGDNYPETSYHLFYKTEDYDILEFNSDFECEDRNFFELFNLEDNHHNLLESHKEILKQLKI